MKKLLLLLFALTVSVAAFSQTCYKVTGNNVFIRKGPGTNYGKVTWSGAYGTDDTEPVKLNRGAFVFSRGAVKNGFMPVSEPVGYASYWEEGWIAAKYLVKATKCTKCNGHGYFKQVCPECKGNAYHMCECRGIGQKICKSCWGVGYK